MSPHFLCVFYTGFLPHGNKSHFLNTSKQVQQLHAFPTLPPSQNNITYYISPERGLNKVHFRAANLQMLTGGLNGCLSTTALHALAIPGWSLQSTP